MTNIIVWNARGIKEKREESIKNIRDHDIFAITESKLDNYNVFNVTEYSTVRLDSTANRSGGIIIFVNKKLDYRVIDCDPILDLNNNCDVAGISIDSIDLDLIIIYRRPYGTTSKSIWTQICRLGMTRKNTIITGNFNSHHTAWNCGTIDINGENLLQFMNNHNFFCLNKDTMSRINSPHERASNIDLIYVSLSTVNLVSYKQLEDSWDSDHFPLLIEYKHGVNTYIKKSNRMSIKCTDWDVFSELSDNFLSDIKVTGTKEGRNLNYYDLTEIMYRAVNITSGRKENFHLKKKTTSREKTYKRNPVKWWDGECKNAIMTRKEKLKTYLKDSTLTSFIEYKKSCAIVRKIVKIKKRENF